MMKIKNKFDEDSKMTQKDLENSKEIEPNSSFFQNNSKKEKIIKDLKQLGCNESQIDGIFETFIRNSIGEESFILDDKKSEITKKTEINESDLPSSARLGKNNQNITKKNGYISMNSKYKNSFIYKAEIFGEKNNKNKSKQNCVKLYINASSEKNRTYLKNSKENEKTNSKKYKNTTFLITPNSTTNNSYTRKNNQKIGNYLRKLGTYHNNTLNMNKIEQNKKDLERKLENELNNKFKNKKRPLYNNYNFKMIFESKKKIENMENCDLTEVESSSLREKERPNIPISKFRNFKEGNIIRNYTNLFNKKRNFASSHSHLSYDLKEIKEEKENNENNKDNEIKENNKNINKVDNINFHTNYPKKNNKNNDECKTNEINNNINKIKNSEDTLNNNIELNVSNKMLYEENINNYKFSSKNRKNIFMIRKQKSEEEENLAKKNTAIIEIKHNDNNPYRNVEFLKYENNNKSKSLSKLLVAENENSNFYDSKRNLSNYNHSFVNINLCKNKSKNNKTFYKLRENSCSKLRNNLQSDLNINLQSSFEELNITEEDILYNRINKINNSEISNFNKKTNAFISNHYSNYCLKKYNSNINFNKYNNNSNSMNKSNVNQNISGKSINLDNTENNCQNKTKVINNRNNINLRYYRSQKNFNKNTEDKPKQLREYENGLYEGIIIDGKREQYGVMIYKNGAKYEGEWKDDKKNGKGVFTSAHYFNCRKNVGMKYEGEFRNDKFEGFGITNYTNGDKYEGEWKNNKQYGKGTVSYFDGKKYSGEWKDGKFEGIGVFYLKNGEKYEGRFINNKYNGYGKYYYINGNYLEGIFRNDNPIGNCLLHKTDGSIVNVHH